MKRMFARLLPIALSVMYLMLTVELFAAPRDSAVDSGAKHRFSTLSQSNSRNGELWYQLAVDARESGDAMIARQALDMAEELNISTVRVGLERARIAIAAEQIDQAKTEIQKIASSGFTAVNVIVNDVVLNTLAGQDWYDALVRKMSIAAYPCAHRQEFRAFDFWLGDWEVRTADDRIAGHNSVTAAQRGCVFLENWTSATGGMGMSINYLDKPTSEWVQIWVSEDGGQIDIRGGLTDDGMLLVGRIYYVADNTTAAFRGLWTPLNDGRVRQFFEQSNDGGETWERWFEGFYTRVNGRPDIE